MCHTWRNYLALGAIGPDLFYLLPDYTGTVGTVVRDVVKWALDVWEAIDSAFLTKWEKWIGPVATDRTQLASQLQGGLGPQLAQVLDEASSAARTDTPYEGRDDAPAYDYWSGFPAYDDSDTPTGAQARHAFFDLDTGPLPAHLVKAIQDVMAGVHPDGPKILAKQPAFSATDAAWPPGRPAEPGGPGRDVATRVPVPQADRQRRGRRARCFCDSASGSAAWCFCREGNA